MDKRGISFSTIVVTLGSILIFIGIIWLIAQNWHYIDAIIKILILTIGTCAAFFSGIMLRIKKHPRIGDILITLGSLLYTASIFLIAQIFSLKTTAQGTAWLFLISWAGVFVFTYIFKCAPSLIIGLIESVIWLVVQFIAFSESARNTIAPGILAFYFLAAGVIVYALSLWHKSNEHDFTKLYQWWTIFYFLSFAYMLSFQTFLSILWPKKAALTMPPITLLAVLVISALGTATVGILAAVRKKALEKKEVIGITIVLAVLLILIGATALTSDKVGVCYKKTCFEYRTQDECNKAPAELKCTWYKGACEIQGCWNLKTQEECQNKDMRCQWNEKGCFEKTCYDYATINECSAAPADLKCVWANGGCNIQGCWQMQTKAECENGNDNFTCIWFNNWCSEYEPCNDYNNNYEQCSEKEQCTWNASGFNMLRNKGIPAVVWAVWIIINIALIGIILAVIWYGTWLKMPSIINIGIIFFALDIITRYIGFIMDLWGYTSLSIIFITGGAILIIGGWLVERWRRKLIQKTGKRK